MAVAVVAISVGIAILQSRAFPRWVGWLAIVIGIAAVTGAASWFAFMASGLLALGLSIALIVRGSDADAISLPDVPPSRSGRGDTAVAAKTTV